MHYHSPFLFMCTICSFARVVFTHIINATRINIPPARAAHKFYNTPAFICCVIITYFNFSSLFTHFVSVFCCLLSIMPVSSMLSEPIIHLVFFFFKVFIFYGLFLKGSQTKVQTPPVYFIFCSA